ncbi:uncharacterized protein LOC143367607 [Andrena cerasifolii]|uniref:uncharacterized protein LOC143367607 n=1 Tax=Andrena cerasifolii TaxID=2819439 RepID=UPI004038450B
MQTESTSISIQTLAGGREFIRRAFLKGIDEDSVDTVINSISESTLKQYKSSLKLWVEFAYKKNIDVLNSTRSAIALISLKKIEKDELISRFLRRVFKTKPSKPKYSSTWDKAPALDYLEKLHPLSKLNHKQVAGKVATLLALATAHRLQTLALIRTNNILESDTCIRIKIPDVIKTSKPGQFQPELLLPFFKKKSSLCVSSTVIEYLDYTKEFGPNNNVRLLISTVKPYKHVSSQTIGHWIKSLLTKAGVDTKHFSTYCTRHAAVSVAFNKGVNV